MPFIGVNPPAARNQGLYGALNATLASAPLNNIVDASAQNTPGHVAFYKDSLGRISVLAYAQAQASVAYGAALQHQAGGATTLNSAGVSTQNGLDTGFVAQATTKLAGYTGAFAGVSAASVINTGYYFWRYISGFVPDAKCGSAIPSGNYLIVSPSTTAALGSIGVQLNATLGTSNFNTARLGVVGHTLALTDNLDGSTASVVLVGWYL